MRKILLLVVAALACVSAAHSQPTIVLDSLTGGLCGEATNGFRSTLYVGIFNPDDTLLVTQFSLRLMDVMTDDSLTFYNDFLELMTPEHQAQTTIDYRWYRHFDTTILTVYPRNMSFDPEYWGSRGLPPTSDTVTYLSISLRPNTGWEGGEFCIDSISDPEGTFPPEMVWLSYPPPSGQLLFGGQKCYWANQPPPNCYQYAFEETQVSKVYTDPCVPIEHWFGLHPVCATVAPIWTIKSGPGVLDSIIGGVIPDESYAHYTCYPEGYHVGDTLESVVQILVDYCGDGSTIWQDVSCTLSVSIEAEYTPDDSPAHFQVKSTPRYTAVTGDTLRVSWPVVDEGPCPHLPYEFGWTTYPDDPVPSNAWVDSTGTFCYLGQTEDTAVYFIRLTLSDGVAADTTGFFIYHFENYLCGDCNHDGAVTLADLSWLISSLFIDFVPPAPPDAGDVDCAPGLTLSDLSTMIDHLFVSMSPMCDCQ